MRLRQLLGLGQQEHRAAGLRQFEQQPAAEEARRAREQHGTARRGRARRPRGGWCARAGGAFRQ
jgi:hypothetical protein